MVVEASVILIVHCICIFGGGGGGGGGLPNAGERKYFAHGDANFKTNKSCTVTELVTPTVTLST